MVQCGEPAERPVWRDERASAVGVAIDRYKKITEDAEEYLFADKLGRQFFTQWVREMEAALFIKEKIDKTVERWQEGFHWKLEYSWELLSRSFVHYKTGERFYSKYDMQSLLRAGRLGLTVPCGCCTSCRGEKAVPKEQRVTSKQLKAIARDNYIGRKEHESAHVVRPHAVL